MRVISLIDSSVLFDLEYGSLAMLTIAVKPKRKYPVRRVSAAKLAVELTPIQSEVLVGTLLGDLSLERVKVSHNARFRFEQTFPGHVSYMMLLYGLFYNLTLGSPSLLFRKPDVRTGKVYVSTYFRSVTLPCLNSFHELFYPNGVKIVPGNIAQLLTARALAF